MKNFSSWTKFELADYLVDNSVYEDIETALLTDRCDLLDECENIDNRYMCCNCGGGFSVDEIVNYDDDTDLCIGCAGD
jgi:hypothetical protein